MDIHINTEEFADWMLIQQPEKNFIWFDGEQEAGKNQNPLTQFAAQAYLMKEKQIFLQYTGFKNSEFNMVIFIGEGGPVRSWVSKFINWQQMKGRGKYSEIHDWIVNNPPK